MGGLADFVDEIAEHGEGAAEAEADGPHEPLEAAIEFRRELVVVLVRLIRAALGFVVGGAGGCSCAVVMGDGSEVGSCLRRNDGERVRV